MSHSQNRDLVANYYSEVVAGGDLTNLSRFIAPDYLDHNSPEGPVGPDSVRSHMEALRKTFPDFSITLHEVIVEGELVASRVTGAGTHLGEWMGIKPSGKTITLRGINIDRVRNGLIAEHWGEADTLGMLIQMGVDPFAGQVAE